MRRKNTGSIGSAIFLMCAMEMFSLGVASPSRAQAVPFEQGSAVPEARDTDMAAVLPSAAVAEQPAPTGATIDVSATPAASVAAPQVGEPAADDDWHITVAPYLWFPGVHGTVGARGHLTSVHASAGDVLSNFRFGLMGLVDTRYKRFVIPIDMMWVRLGDNRALPITDEEISANLKVDEFILTPKVGYRLIDSEIVKVDALAGFRYWHFGQSAHFTPSVEGLNFSTSQNWVDPLVGGRILANLSPKIEVSIGGDVGGWGAGSQLDYQIAGLLGYRIKPAVALQVGYRYLDVNYRSGGTVIDTATSGVVFGVSIMLK